MAALIDLYSCGSCDSEEAIIDMITDLLHVADMIEWSSAQTVLEWAQRDYEEEHGEAYG